MGARHGIMCVIASVRTVSILYVFMGDEDPLPDPRDVVTQVDPFTFTRSRTTNF